MRERYGAIEADFQRFYGLDVWDAWLESPRRAGRLAAELPPEAATYRGESLDEKYLSQESRMLRQLYNLWVEEKGRMETVDAYVEQAEKQARQVAKAQSRLALQRAREGCNCG